MASRTEWTHYELLKSAIEDAISNAMWGCYEPDEDPNEIVLAISEDLENVHCLVDPSSFEVQDFIRQHEGWHIENATNYEDAIGKADLYFDLR